MQLYTTIEIPKATQSIDHHQSILLLGSCFADHIAEHMAEAGFDVCHPFGPLYNPISILQSIQRLQAEGDKGKVLSSELFELHEQWHHVDFHSNYSDADLLTATEKMNQAVAQGHAFLKKKPVIIITLGTAWTYVLKATQHVVANCHRLPAAQFERQRLDLEHTEQALQEICNAFPQQEIIFTVSPIRHFKDGAHENQLSKSILLLAADAICRKNPQAHYFPAYELVLDELRDYRFYNEDLLHPSPVAIQYVWERFGQTYFSATTQQACQEREKISQMEKHRPFDSNSQGAKALRKDILQRLEHWKQHYL